MKEIAKIHFLMGILLIIGMILGTSFMKENASNINTKRVDETISLVEKQTTKELSFKMKNYTINKPKIIVDPYDISPLTALVIFKTKTKVTPKVTIVGKDKLTTYTHTFNKDTNHYLSIYGLYPNKDNKVIIEYKENNKKIKKTLTIKTSKLPSDMIIPEKINKDESSLTNDLYFYTPSSKGYTTAYDVNGDVRWYLKTSAIWKIDKLKNGHLLLSTERLVNSPYYMTGLYEIDLLGKIYTEYSLPGGYHHDYYEMDNGNLLVGTDDFNNSYGTVEDYIVELDRKTGKIVKHFDLKDILEMNDGKSENWSSYDWFHNNSIWYDKKTNSITLSGRHQDAIINIDYKTGNLNWIIGDSTKWSSKYKKYFFKPIGKDFEWQWSQHAAMITPEGYVFVFDNGNNKSKDKDNYVKAENSYSRGVMYKIDTKKMTIKQVYEYGKERGSSFYSPYISDVDYLSQNHYIIHSGGIVYVDGVNSNQPAGFSKNTTLVSDTVELINNKVVFELKLPTNTYRVEKMSLYNQYENLKLGKAKRLGTLGKTKIDKRIRTFNLNSKKINDKYRKHNISITKEIDRLVIKGKFRRENKVKIVLYKNGKSRYYNVKVSKKPYTALCVDLFTEEENKYGIDVTKYINKDGLSGKYSIYIELDNTLYNTEKYVEF